MRRSFLIAPVVVLFAMSLPGTATAVTSLPNFKVEIVAKKYSHNGVTGQHVKTIKISGAGARKARPFVTCGKNCGRNRLFKGKTRRSKLFKSPVKFTNVNWLVAPGKGLRVNMIPRRKSVQAVFVSMVAPDALNPGFTMGAAGCITRKQKVMPCPAGVALPTLNHVSPAPPAPTCPAQSLSTTSLAPYLGHLPRGTVEFAGGAEGNSILVHGWSFDPDEPQTSIQVHAYYDDPPNDHGSAYLANMVRQDVADVYPGANPNHGFAFQIPNVPAGSHTLRVYGINVGTGENALIWGGTIGGPVAGFPGGTPLGGLDEPIAIGCDSVKISGWSLDPDSPTLSILSHIYLDGWYNGGGTHVATAEANIARADVASAQPGAGATHGYSATVGGLTPGIHAFFVFGINMTGGGTNPLLGVRYVKVG
jgi:hypothetical protein